MKTISLKKFDLISLEGDEGKAPTKMLLFKAGENKTTKGSFVYNTAFKDMLVETSQTVDKLPIDIAHLSFVSDNPEAHKSYGFFELLADEEGIWANNIEWNEEGKKLVENKSFRYFSPTFLVAEDGLTILTIFGVSLTNNPATIGVEPLVAHKINEKLKEEIMFNKTKTEENKKVTLSQEQVKELVEEAINDYKTVKEAEVEEQSKLFTSEKEELLKQIENITKELNDFKNEYKKELLSKAKLSENEINFWEAKPLDDVKEYLSAVVNPKMDKIKEVANNLTKAEDTEEVVEDGGNVVVLSDENKKVVEQLKKRMKR